MRDVAAGCVWCPNHCATLIAVFAETDGEQLHHKKSKFAARMKRAADAVENKHLEEGEIQREPPEAGPETGESGPQLTVAAQGSNKVEEGSGGLDTLYPISRCRRPITSCC